MALYERKIREIYDVFQVGDYRRVRTLCGKVLKKHPKSPDALKFMGLAELRLGRPHHAVPLLHKVSALCRDDPVANYNLGLARYRSGDHAEAVPAFERAIHLDRGFAQAYSDLALCLKECQRYDEAIMAAEKACRIDPRSARYMNNAGVIYQEYGLFELASDKYQIAVELDPVNPVYLKNHGLALLGYGEREQAGACFKAALKSSQDYGEAWRHYVMTKAYSDCGDEDIKILEGLRCESGMMQENRVDILFALAKVYDDCGCHPQAFNCLKEANEIESARFGFSVERLQKKYRTHMEVFRGIELPAGVRSADAEPIPIFIVGLPRSGTSLVERLLSGHSQIFASGERYWFNVLEQNFQELVGGVDTYPHCLRNIGSDILSKMASEYRSHLASLSTGQSYVIDKLPANFERLGLINMMFPVSPIIHCARNAMDVCWSMYRQRFPGSLHYSYSLKHLGAYACFHQRLMDFWHDQLPDRILDIQYERLVIDPESGLRRMLDFIGLPWQDVRLESAPRRWVNTASDCQVHGEIYQSSGGKWKPYEQYLTELRAILDGCHNWG